MVYNLRIQCSSFELSKMASDFLQRICKHRFQPKQNNVIDLDFYFSKQPFRLPRLNISKCKHSKIDRSYHKITFNSQKAKIWAKVKSFDQFHEN